MLDMSRASILSVSHDKTYVEATVNLKFAQGESNLSKWSSLGHNLANLVIIMFLPYSGLDHYIRKGEGTFRDSHMDKAEITADK